MEEKNKNQENSVETQEGQVAQNNQGQPSDEGEYSGATENQGLNNLGNLLSPEGVIMLLVALSIDIISIFLLFLGLDDFGITDIIGIITIGTWAFIKAGSIPDKKIKTPSKDIEGSAKLAKSNPILKRFGIAGILEVIPYLGALPMWTRFVYQTLVSQN